MLRSLWNQRHRVFRLVRSAQAILGDFLARLPLPVSLKLMIADLTFLACDSFIFHTEAYLKWRGQRIGRGRIHALLKSQNAPEVIGYAPSAPTEEEWSATVPLPTEGARVDVIVPVYNGYEATLRCLHSVLSSRNKTPFELIVINDASTDTALSARLYELAGRELFTLLENTENKGFVATVNRGMQLHPERDALLLNADTQVFGDWLDRLRAHARNGGRLGSITPLSNNAGICSYPGFLQNNVPVENADALAAKANAGKSCELPTAVGFCMYIPRACLEEVGYFDEEAFGRGYGEENDFCLRASALGYAHLLAGDVYVLHAGGVSFGAEKSPREKEAWKLLKRRYPDYSRQVADFVARDPALGLRRAIDLAHLTEKKQSRNVLMISHGLGGGTEKHIAQQLEALERDEKTGGFLLSPIVGSPGMLALSHSEIPSSPNLIYALNGEHLALSAALETLGISRIQVHHLLGFPDGMAEYIRALAERLGTGYEVMLHDYYFLCPRINLTTEQDEYCGEPELPGCESCIATRSSYAGDTPVWLWRERAQYFLLQAKRITAPDVDVSARFHRHFPTLRIDVVAHEKHLGGFPDLSSSYQPGEMLTVGILGALSPLKGARVVEALLKDAQARALPVRFILIGYSDYAPLQKKQPGWSVTGAYKDEEVESLLREHRPHLLLYPSIWPETYNYALSHAFRYRIPPVVFDLGAQAARVKAQRFGHVVPLALAHDATLLNDALLSLVNEEKKQAASA